MRKPFYRHPYLRLLVMAAMAIVVAIIAPRSLNNRYTPPSLTEAVTRSLDAPYQRWDIIYCPDQGCVTLATQADRTKGGWALTEVRASTSPEWQAGDWFLETGATLEETRSYRRAKGEACLRSQEPAMKPYVSFTESLLGLAAEMPRWPSHEVTQRHQRVKMSDGSELHYTFSYWKRDLVRLWGSGRGATGDKVAFHRLSASPKTATPICPTTSTKRS